MPVNNEVIAFEGYLSRLKLAAGLLFMLCCFYSVVFSTVQDHQYFGWLFLPWAQPIRVTLAVAIAWLNVIIIILLIKSLLSTPLIKVEDGWVEINGIKRTKFLLSAINSISNKSSRYTLKVGKKKYDLPISFCRDREWLEERMEDLAIFVSANRPFGDA